jgi:hypothetical protein
MSWTGLHTSDPRVFRSGIPAASKPRRICISSAHALALVRHLDPTVGQALVHVPSYASIETELTGGDLGDLGRQIGSPI